MEDITIIKLIKLFARINTQFTNLESDLNELPDFQDVKRYCEFRERNGKSLISLGIDSELIQPYKGGIFSSDPLFSIGISFEIWKENGSWKLNGDVGRSRLHGFENTKSIEKDYPDINMMLDQLDETITNLLSEYNSLIDITLSYKEAHS